MEIWDLYFSTVVGWSLHPGYCKPDAKPLSLEQCADWADHMLEIRKRRVKAFKVYGPDGQLKEAS